MIYRLLVISVFLVAVFVLKAGGKRLDPRLEPLAQEAIKKTKQIHIPGFAKAFNPSLIPYKDGYLLSFRIRHRTRQPSAQTRKKDVSFIGVVKLDKDFRVCDTARLLDITSYAPHLSSTAEDARLFTIADRVYLVFNDFYPSGKGFALYAAELIENHGGFALKESAKLLRYERAIPIEKNWSPFVAEDKLYLIYSDAPRVILEADLSSGLCTEMGRTECHWKWNWGEIRGGTPALPIGDQLVTFFHSSLPSNQKRGRLYVMGAYTFDAHFPFSPSRVSPVPLGAKEYYTEENGHNVVFPGGLVIQENCLHVVWGKNNKQVYVTTFDTNKLLSSLE